MILAEDNLGTTQWVVARVLTKRECETLASQYFEITVPDVASYLHEMYCQSYLQVLRWNNVILIKIMLKDFKCILMINGNGTSTFKQGFSSIDLWQYFSIKVSSVQFLYSITFNPLHINSPIISHDEPVVQWLSFLVSFFHIDQYLFTHRSFALEIIHCSKSVLDIVRVIFFSYMTVWY